MQVSATTRRIIQLRPAIAVGLRGRVGTRTSIKLGYFSPQTQTIMPPHGRAHNQTQVAET